MDIKQFYFKEGEEPLDNIVSDGGFFKIFRKVVVIGDSLASGEFESCMEKNIKGWNDFYEYSWGQFMAREAGCEVLNFSRGGMTAKEFPEYARIKGWWDNYYDAQAFIIALGVNDFREKYAIGTIENAKDKTLTPTYATYLSYIIERYKAKQPKAKFFLMSSIRSDRDPEEKLAQRLDHRNLLYDFAEYYDNTYVLDMYEYAPIMDDEFRRNFYLGGHLNAQGYVYASKLVMSYIDYIIRKHPEDFAQVPFIGKPFHNVNVKW